MLMQEGNRCGVVTYLQSYVTFEQKRILIVYDCDEKQWVHIYDLRHDGDEFVFNHLKKVLKKSNWSIANKVYRHPLTWKFVQRRGVMIQASRLDTLQHVKRSQIPDNTTSVDITKDSVMLPFNLQSYILHGLWNSVLKHLTTYVNRGIFHLSLKDMPIWSSHIELLGMALPCSSLTSLNISNIYVLDVDSNESSFKPIFDNAMMLQHLNINFDGPRTLSNGDTLACIRMLKTTTNLAKLKMRGTVFDVPIADTFRVYFTKLQWDALDTSSADLLLITSIQSCASLRTLHASFDARSDELRERRLSPSLCELHMTQTQGNDSEVVSQEALKGIVFEQWHQELQQGLDAFLQHFTPVNVVQKGTKRAKVQAKYDKRNAHRNQLLPSDRACKFCDVVWSAGSIKIQTFEGLQSNCKLGKRRCCDSSHFQSI